MQITEALLPTDFDDAESAYERIVKIISDFECNLDESKQAALRLVQFGNLSVLVDSIGYWNPNILIIYGKIPSNSDSDSLYDDVQIVQHLSQLNFCLISANRIDTDSPRRKIGFSQDSPKDAL